MWLGDEAMIKSVVLKGLSKTNTSEAEYDKVTVTAGMKWTLLEVRPFFSRQANVVECRLYRLTAPILQMNSDVENSIKKPVPVDAELGAGEELRLTGVTDGGAGIDFIVAVIYDETGV